jgi:hypothetical protein
MQFSSIGLSQPLPKIIRYLGALEDHSPNPMKYLGVCNVNLEELKWPLSEEFLVVVVEVMRRLAEEPISSDHAN